MTEMSNETLPVEEVIEAPKNKQAEQPVSAPKYRKRVEATVSDINAELTKIMASNSTLKNVAGIESDLTKLNKKINELKKVMQTDKKEPEFSCSSTQKLAKQIDKLIDIASKNDIEEADQDVLLKELRRNLSETSGYVSILQKAMSKTEQVDEFSFDS